MPLLTIRHVTDYRYKAPVSLGEHRIMMRPREAFDQHLLSARLDINPKPSELRWLHDVFGNSVAMALFERRTSQLTVTSEATLEHAPLAQGQVDVEAYAKLFPFTYSSEDMPDLLRSIERQHHDPERIVDNWARRFVSNHGDTETVAMLTAMATGIKRDFTYVPRHEKGTQTPIETLRKRQGTCRDFAVLMIEAVRALGFAARFVSGYVYNPSRKQGVVGGGNTHAWVRIFLPGVGMGRIRSHQRHHWQSWPDPRRHRPRPLSGLAAFWHVVRSARQFPGNESVCRRFARRPRQISPFHPWSGQQPTSRYFRKGTCMLIRCGYDISFEAETRTAMMAMLSLHPSRHHDLRTAQRLRSGPDMPLYHYEDSFGNVATRLTVPPGGVRLSCDFVIEDSGEPDRRPPAGPQMLVEDLPDDVMIFLLGSRYCETDRLMDVAWANFSHYATARDRVDAIVDFVHNHIEFGYHHARPDKTAWDGYQERLGVCRDFAHLAITLCRCMNIPARYCTGYLGDIGIPPVDAPMDFSAWFDVYIDGEWYTHDARHNRPRIGRILMARGRDATDVALTTAFGPAKLVRFEVHTDEVQSID